MKAKADAINSLEGDGQEESNCGTFCGKRSPFCKDIRDGRTVCEGTINLDTKQKCEDAFGGKTCKRVNGRRMNGDLVQLNVKNGIVRIVRVINIRRI